MEKLIKLYFFAIFISVVFTFQSKKSGEFVLIVDSVDNFPNASREFADWHISVKRMGKSERVIVGYYRVKKDVVNPKVDLETYFLTNNMFLKVDLNHPKVRICDESTQAFFEEYLEGNSTITEDCTIKPGYVRVKEDRPVDLNEWSHRLYQKVFYGTFKFIAKVVDREGNIVVQFAWTARTISKD